MQEQDYDKYVDFDIADEDVTKNEGNNGHSEIVKSGYVKFSTKYDVISITD